MTSARRELRFENVDAALAEVARLRRGYVQRGKWTLPQALWHVSKIIADTLAPAAPGATATPEQAAAKAGFVDPIVAAWRGKTGLAGGPPIEAPPPYVPPAEIGHEAHALFEREFTRLRDFPGAIAQVGPFGPVAIDEVRALHLFHLAHHLSFLDPQPATRRLGLSYATDDEVMADVRLLERGYAQAGAWSLPQICWHLEATTQARMKPPPYPETTDEQKARRPVLEQTLASGRLPDGIVAPEALVPPPNLGEDSIRAFMDALRRFSAHPGPFAPHRLFGQLSIDDMRRINRIHCAHHLSYLTPTSTTKT